MQVSGKGLGLQAYLIKPVQRLLKYPLLIREMLKYAPPDYRGREELELANKTIQVYDTPITLFMSHAVLRTLPAVSTRCRERRTR